MKKYLKWAAIALLTVFGFFYLIDFFSYNNTSRIHEPIIFNNDKFEEKTIKKEEIVSLRKITYEENDISKIRVYNYVLDIKNVPSKIFSVAIDLDKVINTQYLRIDFHKKDKSIKTVSRKINFNLDKNIISILVNEENIEEIVVTALAQRNPTSVDFNENILDINNISVNNLDSINDCKNYALFNTMLTFIYIILIVIFFKILKKYDIDKHIVKIINKIGIYKIFVISGLIIGISFSFLFPLYQIPDESAHIDMIYSELNQPLDFKKATNNFGDTDRIIADYKEKVDFNAYFNFETKLHNSLQFKLPSISIIKHLPQAFGIVIGEFFHLPVIVVIALCEILATLFYVGMCYLALKIMPIKKHVLALCMLLPICIQQMGSFSYDVVLLPICFLLVSYILHLKFVKEKINLGDLAKILAIILAIAIIKIPYVLLGGLVILLPLKKINIRLFKLKIDYDFIKKHKYIFILILLIIIGLGIYAMSKISYGRLMLSFFVEPIAFIKMILRSVRLYYFEYIHTTFGKFGWHDTPVSLLFIVFSLLCVIAFSFIKIKKKKSEEDYEFKRWERVFLIAFFIFMSAIIILSMYEWTIWLNGVTGFENYSISQIADFIKTKRITIGGVQGRYFVPFIVLFLLPLDNNKIKNKINQYNPVLLQFLYYCIVIIYMLVLIISRYWIH